MQDWRAILIAAIFAIVLGTAGTLVSATEMDEEEFFKLELNLSQIGSTRFDRYVESYRGVEKPGTIIGDTLYRIHRTNDARTVGRGLSSECIRMLSDNIIHLFEKVKVGARVAVR